MRTTSSAPASRGPCCTPLFFFVSTSESLISLSEKKPSVSGSKCKLTFGLSATEGGGPVPASGLAPDDLRVPLLSRDCRSRPEGLGLATGPGTWTFESAAMGAASSEVSGASGGGLLGAAGMGQSPAVGLDGR